MRASPYNASPGAALLAAFLAACATGGVGGASDATPAGTLIVANMSDNTTTLIDLDRGRPIATLPTGPAPHEVAVTGDGRTALVTNYGDRSAAGRSITVIDVPSASVRATIDLPLYERPHGIAVLPGDSLAVVTSETAAVVVVVHIDSGEIRGAIPTEGRASHMLGVDAAGRRVFTTNIVDGTISELDPEAGAFVRTIPVAPVVEGLTVSPDGRHVWVGSNRERTVSVVDVARGTVIDTLMEFGFPYRMGITPDGRTAVLVDPARAEIRIVDTGTREERTRVTVPAVGVVPGAEFPDSPSPEGIAMGRGSRFAYVALQGRNEAAAIDLLTGAIAATYPTGVWPDGIGYSPLSR